MDRSFLPEYKKQLFILGKTVTVLNGDKRREAASLGIDDAYRLKVRYEDGTGEYL